MKKYIKLFIFCLLCFLTLSVNADVDYTTHNNYDVVYIKNSVSETACNSNASSIITYKDEDIEFIMGFDNYADAFSYMNTLDDVDGKSVALVGKRKNQNDEYVNKILTSKYALVDLNTAGSSAVTTNIYTKSTNLTTYTYINGYGYFGGGDGAFISYSNDNSRAKIKVSGAEGWIKPVITTASSSYNGYEVIPLSAVKSPSYYYVNANGELVHRMTDKMTASNCYSGYNNLGPAPSFMTSKDSNDNQIKYYSYDGIYFYTDLKTMLTDYKNDNNDNAVNKIPYYNYYMYSSVRTKSKITSDDIKAYLDSRSITASNSALYATELTFIDAQDKYGVNAIISLSTAINESGWGKSTLALTKNNLFGHNAYDSSVMTSANSYNTVSDGIYRHAWYYINTGFVETKDAVARYYGGHLGNKGSGINVKYASDVYWGEKIAAIYYSIDNYSGLKDYYSNTIGIKTIIDSVPVMSEPNTTSTTLYKLESYYVDVKNMPVVILGKVNGESIDGNDVWYKIQTDALLTSDRTSLIRDCTKDDYYDWNNNYAYIHSSYITLMDESVEKIYSQIEGSFDLSTLSYNGDGTINLTGYLIMNNIDNSKNRNISYDLLLVDKYDNTYTKSLNRILDESLMPYNIIADDGYDYSYSWFTGNLNLSDIPEGDYELYVRARSGSYESIVVLSNKMAHNILSKFTYNDRGYQFKTNYYVKTVPVELFIRDNGLIVSDDVSTFNNMVNYYTDIDFIDGKLNIVGASYNAGGDYSTGVNVERSIVFENIATFERFTFDLGYTDTPVYDIVLAVSDNLSKTRAWFNNSIDISSIPPGSYAVYIKTKTNISDAAELIDIFSRSIDKSMTINDKSYTLVLNKEIRNRVELIIK